MDSSFFMDVEFNDTINQFSGRFTASKLINVNFYESVDNCISKALAILKTKSDATITFTFFRNYESISLLRIFSDYSGRMSQVTWKYNNYGYVSETHKTENIPVDKKHVRAAVLDAIEIYRQRQEEENAA